MTLLTAFTTASALFCAGALLHLAVCRATRTKMFMQNGLLTGLAPILGACLVQYRAGRFDPVLFYMVVTLWLAYLMFFINLLHSVTLKMLENLAASPAGKLRACDFAQIFAGDAINYRLKAMKNNRFIKEEKAALSITPRGRLLLATVKTIRKILSIEHAD